MQIWDTPKSSILIGFSTINQPFLGFGKPPYVNISLHCSCAASGQINPCCQNIKKSTLRDPQCSHFKKGILYCIILYYIILYCIILYYTFCQYIVNLLNIYRPSTFLNFSTERSIKEGAHEFSSIQGGAPMVINWFMNPMNTSSIYHQQKPTIVNLEL